MTYVTQGKNMVTAFLGGLAPGSPAFMQLGSVGSPTFTTAGSLMRFPVHRTFRTFDSKVQQGQQLELTMILPSTEPSGIQPITLREVGVTSGSPMTLGSTFNLATFAGVSKTTDVELQTIVAYRVL